MSCLRISNRNQNGITLIETLLALSVSSIVVGVVFSALINTLNLNEKSHSNIFIQQEANLFLTQLTNIHLYNSNYHVVYEGASNSYKIILQDMSELQLNNPEYQYEVYINSTLLNQNTTPIFISGKELKVKVKITDAKNKNDFSVETTLDKL
jgi:type II secretory pathway pseudopilin PulG